MELLTDDEDYLVRMHRMLCTHGQRRKYAVAVTVHSFHGKVFYKVSLWDEGQGVYLVQANMLPTARDAFEVLYGKLKDLKLL